MHWKHLSIGSGAMGFYAYLGALTCLRDRIDSIETIHGVSTGSILGLLLAMGKTVDEIFDRTIDINPLEKLKPGLKNLIKNYGLIDHSQVKTTFIDICEGNPTFKDLEKDLYICTYNVTLGRIEYFSRYTHPDMEVIDAVCMSISIPFAFCPMVRDGFYYVDGAIREAIPVSMLWNTDARDILTLHVDQNGKYPQANSLLEYFRLIIYILMSSTNVYTLGTVCHIELDRNLSIFDFAMSRDTKLKLFYEGFKSAGSV